MRNLLVKTGRNRSDVVLVVGSGAREEEDDEEAFGLIRGFPEPPSFPRQVVAPDALAV
jgi:hypothetical protein